jgi:4-hydroxybenzoate polyprenyltransferase
MQFVKQIKLYASLVRFSHTIFALPFALSMFVVVSRNYLVTLFQLLYIILALVSARTAAMCFNRLVDRKIDALNPRTDSRELPAGKISFKSVLVLLLFSSFIFILSAALLGRHCLILSPLVLIILCGYSYAKRFTSYSHFILGLALACAPGGVWYALTAQFALLPVWMMLGVLFWVAGFDILYSLQDQEFDLKQKLYSIPAKVGSYRAVQYARIAHLIAIIFFTVFGFLAELGVLFWLGLIIFAGLLLNQHKTISPDRLEKIEATFFTRNAWGSVVFFVGVLIDFLF